MDLAYAAYNGAGAFSGGTMKYSYTQNAQYRPVFYIYERQNCLWVCIRGSGSQDDWNTDFDYQESSHQFGSYSITCHGGFYRSAEFVYGQVKQYLYDYNGNIYITGHSYGASVSTIVSLMAMTDPKLSGKLAKMGGFCFAAAPSVDNIPSPLDKKICTFVYNNDIVPTLSLVNAYNVIKPMIPKSGVPTFLVKIALKTTIAILHEKKQEFSQSLYNSIMANIDPIVDDINAYHTNKNHIKVSHVCGIVYAINNKDEKLEACLTPGENFNILSSSNTALDDHYQSKYVEALKHKTD